MKNEEKIKIDAQMLIAALQDNSIGMNYYLNLKTGQIETLIDDYFPENEEVEAEIENKYENFVQIFPIPSYVTYNIMVKFTEQIENDDVKNRLFEVLNARKPFYNFKATLWDYLDIRTKWFEFRDKKWNALAKEWLIDHQINGELVR